MLFNMKVDWRSDRSRQNKIKERIRKLIRESDKKITKEKSDVDS